MIADMRHDDFPRSHLVLSLAHDLFGKPVSTFSDHALGRAGAQAAATPVSTVPRTFLASGPSRATNSAAASSSRASALPTSTMWSTSPAKNRALGSRLTSIAA